jgi:hypothetical protein
MTQEEGRAAAYLESCARRQAYQATLSRGRGGSEGARRQVDEGWDALRPDGAQKYEPKRLAEARKVAGCEDEES